MNQLFWNAYRRLEKEVLALSEAIHFDDSQLGVYSSKIGDLLVRTVIEIESLSKVLYFANGGTQPVGRGYAYFDTDCLALLESKWKIGKKVIQVSSPYLYFEGCKQYRLGTGVRVIYGKGQPGVWRCQYQ